MKSKTFLLKFLTQKLPQPYPKIIFLSYSRMKPDFDDTYFSHLSPKEQFNYFYNEAEKLYKIRYEPYTDDFEREWTADRMNFLIQKYMSLDNMQDQDLKYRLTDVMFVTYNPRPDVSLRNAIQVVEQFVKKSKIDKYIYAIEQRATTEATMNDGNSFHIHIIHTHKYDRSSHYIRETKSTFNKTCMVKNWRCLNILPSTTDQDITNRLNYIIGDKKDDNGLMKTEKQKIDKIFRERYMLKDYYTNDKEFWVKYYDF